MSETIEQKCISKGVNLTDQRRIIAKVMSEAQDHPDVDELYNRVSEIDSRISIATVYRTVKLFEEAGIVAKHDFKGGKARYEQLSESHHDHLIDIKTGEIIEFVDDEIEKLQKKVAEIKQEKSILIASGGVMNESDVKERLINSADLVQLYTGYIYQGNSLLKQALKISSS